MANDEDIRAALKAMIRANRELTGAMERLIGEDAGEEGAFVPTDFQREILKVLKGKALTSTALAAKLDCPTSRLYKNPGGLPELIEEGLVRHRKRVGYYRPDAMPPDLSSDENT